MKLVDPNRDNWKEINKIVLVVNTIDCDYSEKITVNINCNFENISDDTPRLYSSFFLSRFL